MSLRSACFGLILLLLSSTLSQEASHPGDSGKSQGGFDFVAGKKDASATSERPATLVWPSDTDFLTVMQGGQEAAAISAKLADGFTVPESGYISVTTGMMDDDGGGGDEIVMCPGPAETIDDCPNDGKPLSGNISLSLGGINLGPQHICLRAFSRSRDLLSTQCATITGSTYFPGRKESAEHFSSNIDQFVSSSSLTTLWTRLQQYVPPEITSGRISCHTLHVSTGEPECFLTKYSLRRPALPKGAENLVGCRSVSLQLPEDDKWFSRGEGVIHQHKEGGTGAVPQGEGIDEHLQNAVWGGNVGTLVIDVSSTKDTSGLPSAFDNLFSLLDECFSSHPQVILIKFSAASPRRGLGETVAWLFKHEYVTFAVSDKRIVPVSQRMWKSAAYEETVFEAAGESSALWFGAVKKGVPGFLAFMASYNETGMVVECHDRWLSAFHENEYVADDCPMVHGVFRSSRLRLFEDELGSRPGFELSEASLMRHRHNVYSEAGEDGIVEHLIEALGIQGTVCFEFGAWDGMFASNCRLLIEHGWAGIMVEADANKFIDLERKYQNHPQVALVNGMVVAEGDYSIAGLIAAYSPTGSVNVLSIDVDGLDYDLLSTLQGVPNMRPEIIIAECNGFIRPDLKAKLGPELAKLNMQQSLLIFREKGRDLGYELVCFTQNAIFLRSDLAERLRELQGRQYEIGVNRLYFEALLVNWNDMIRNVRLTRAGMPRELVEAETKEFGSYDAQVDLQELLRRAEEEEDERY